MSAALTVTVQYVACAPSLLPQWTQNKRCARHHAQRLAAGLPRVPSLGSANVLPQWSCSGSPNERQSRRKQPTNTVYFEVFRHVEHDAPVSWPIGHDAGHRQVGVPLYCCYYKTILPRQTWTLADVCWNALQEKLCHDQREEMRAGLHVDCEACASAGKKSADVESRNRKKVHNRFRVVLQ